MIKAIGRIIILVKIFQKIKKNQMEWARRLSFRRWTGFLRFLQKTSQKFRNQGDLQALAMNKKSIMLESITNLILINHFCISHHIIIKEITIKFMKIIISPNYWWFMLPSQDYYFRLIILLLNFVLKLTSISFLSVFFTFSQASQSIFRSKRSYYFFQSLTYEVHSLDIHIIYGHFSSKSHTN